MRSEIWRLFGESKVSQGYRKNRGFPADSKRFIIPGVCPDPHRFQGIVY